MCFFVAVHHHRAASSAGTRAGMTDFLYRVAAFIGLRAYALAMLRPVDFDFTTDPGMVVSAAKDQKNKTTHRIPLAPSIVAELREYLKDRNPMDCICCSPWNRFAARMLRVDLAAADVPESAADGHLHFHSWQPSSDRANSHARRQRSRYTKHPRIVRRKPLQHFYLHPSRYPYQLPKRSIIMESCAGA
jgi:integrase